MHKYLIALFLLTCLALFDNRYHQNPGTRVFDLTIEGKPFYAVDINLIANGRYKAVTLQTAQVVDDGSITISVAKNDTTSVDNPKISGIEVKRLAPHTAHSVSGGPYAGVDVTDKGYAIIPVDGGGSHTHGPGLVLDQWIWKEGAKVLATGQTANLNLAVGEHSVVLTVLDSGGNDSAETFTVSIQPFGFPSISVTSPSAGTMNGNQLITITGSGFNFTAAQTYVHFGLVNLTGSAIQVINRTTITVLSPPVAIATPVSVSVSTPIGISTAVTFTYEASSPIAFDSAKLVDLGSATVATFGPDEKLYVGTLYGKLAKITLNSDFTAVASMTISTVTNYKAILGIAFDPMDAGNPNPPVYISSSYFFHGESNNTFGEAINGKVHRVTGANLDVVQNIIVGLPVSDSDHGTYTPNYGVSLVCCALCR
jgi:IPT/TIG domain